MPLLPVKPSLNCNINISLALQKFCKDEKHNINLKGTDLDFFLEFRLITLVGNWLSTQNWVLGGGGVHVIGYAMIPLGSVLSDSKVPNSSS